MVSQVNKSERSFGDWFLDESIPGHLPLVPIIWISDTGLRIISPLPASCGDATLEIIKRIFFAIIFIPIAIIGTVLIIPGLISKLIGGALCMPPEVIVSSSPPPSPPSDSLSASTESVHSTPQNTPRGESPRIDPPVYSSQELESLKAAHQILDQISARLKEIKVDYILKKVPILHQKAVDSLKTTEDLLKDPQIGMALCTTSKDPADPFNAFMERYQLLRTHCDYFQRIELNNNGLLSNSIIRIEGGGNCLFDSFFVLSNLDDSISEGATSERRKAVKYMRDHYKTDMELQKHLANQIPEHLVSLVRSYQEDIASHETVVALAQEGQGAFPSEDLIAEYEQKKNKVETLPKICDAFIVTTFANLESKKPPLEGISEEDMEIYFQEMEKDGIDGGASEMYALCRLHSVTAHIHQNGNIRVIPENNPPLKIKDFEYDGRHYNARLSPSSSELNSHFMDRSGPGSLL